MKIARIHLYCALISILVFSSTAAYSQCKPFIKKQCMPQLTPYTNDGQLNNTVLRSGETAELGITFYSGQNYRLLVCYQEVLGRVDFKLFDINRNLLFNSKNSKEDKNFWDFNIETTQELIVEVSAPAGKKNEIIQSGCVAVMVGFKDAK